MEDLQVQASGKDDASPEQPPPRKRTRTSEAGTGQQPLIPMLDPKSKDFSPQKILDAYQKFQAVHLPDMILSMSRDDKEKSRLRWTDLLGVFEKLGQADKDSWCIETKGHDEKKLLSPASFLAPKIVDERAYCSFLVQKDKEAYNNMLQKLPISDLGFDEKCNYEPCIWVFFGRNNTQNGSPLEGRGLHTDSVNHSGTWHFQLSGDKDWFISPSCRLLDHWKALLSPEELVKWNESTIIPVKCKEGDVIVLNTRLWFHRTMIPEQENPSVSYARDFRLESSISSLGGDDDCKKSDGGGGMQNLDGLYARSDIESGTIIFTERDMPDCELHRAKEDPNCEVVELEDGRSAVVSRRAIACGEFFSVAESSDEDESESEGEECEQLLESEEDDEE